MPGLASHWLGAHNERFAPIWCTCLEDYPDSPFVTQRAAFSCRMAWNLLFWRTVPPFLTNNPKPEEILQWQCLPMTS
jgi:hypothetical protein